MTTGIEEVRSAKKRAFCEALARTGVIGTAAKIAGINHQTYYNWVDADEDFAEQVKLAKIAAADLLEAEARRRAVEGWDEPVFWQGEEVGGIRKYDSTLLIFLLKGEKPEKYRERYDVRVGDSVPVVFPEETLKDIARNILGLGHIDTDQLQDDLNGSEPLEGDFREVDGSDDPEG
jgi:hypothetical protein